MTNLEHLKTLDAEELAWKLFFRLGLNESQRNHFEMWLNEERK